jgi:hypothetical protein
MQNENRQYPKHVDPQHSGAASAGGQQAGAAAPTESAPQDFIQMKGWIQQAREEAHRARTLAEQSREDIREIERELDEQGGKSSRSGWATAILALLLIGACAWGYFKLSGNDALMAQFPAVQTALNSVGDRMNATEQKFRDWSSNWDGMNSRMAKVEKSAGATLQAARNYTVEQTAKAQQQVQAEMNNRSRATDESIAKLQMTHQEDEKQIAQLKQDLAQARTDTSQQLARAQQETSQGFDGLRSAMDRNRNDVDVLAHNMAKTRVDFEISKEKTREVAPGVTLTVSGTDVSYQRVEGRLHVVADGRILWIRGQGIQQPVRFYSHKDDRPYELVFTRVSKDTAIGYILMPSGTPDQASAQRGSLGEAAALASNSAPTSDARPAQ